MVNSLVFEKLRHYWRYTHERKGPINAVTELHGRRAQWCRPRYSTLRCESIPFRYVTTRLVHRGNTAYWIWGERAWMIEKSEFQSDFPIFLPTCSKKSYPLSICISSFLFNSHVRIRCDSCWVAPTQVLETRSKVTLTLDWSAFHVGFFHDKSRTITISAMRLFEKRRSFR